MKRPMATLIEGIDKSLGDLMDWLEKNVVASHPDIVRRLSQDLGGYLRKVDAQRPTVKATGQPCPWPDER